MTGYLGLGSNVGDRRAHLQAAVDALPAHGVRVVASSATYETEPVGLVLDQPAFLNACLRDRDGTRPRGAARRLQGRRGAGGADRYGGVRHGPREIDVDLLLLGDASTRASACGSRTPRSRARRFVLIPLLELDFDLATPDGTRLSDCLAVLPVLGESVVRAGDPLTL